MRDPRCSGADLLIDSSVELRRPPESRRLGHARGVSAQTESGTRGPGVPFTIAPLIARGWNYQGLEGFAVRTTFHSRNWNYPLLARLFISFGLAVHLSGGPLIAA